MSLSYSSDSYEAEKLFHLYFTTLRCVIRTSNDASYD